MNYEQLDTAYWSAQIERVLKFLEVTKQRTQTTPGRVVPESEDLILGTGRTINAAIMFLDISGFSARPAEFAFEQEDLLRVLNLFFTEMIKIIEDYGGTVEKNTGDGLMAYFEDNAGSPTENGTKRALSCALTMMYAGVNLVNTVLRASGIQEVQFRISIDYGSVTIARVGAPKRFNGIVAIGTKANIASKMLAYAAPGDILLGASAYRQIPLTWQTQWTQFLTATTGWVFRATNQPYPFYKYTGRWTGPR